MVIKNPNCYSFQDISQPFASRRYDFEYYLGGPHLWVGGDMSSPMSNGYDPVFYLHHSFVDYVYELFRRRQFRRCGVDPALDYPDLPSGDTHAADSPMMGFDWLTNRDGIKHDWMDNWYDYESTPSCPNCCEGCTFPPPIYCDRRRRVCVARSRRQFAFGPVRDSQTRIQDIFAQAQLEPREIESLEYQSPPRNRGHEYQAPPSDGRTIQTAIADAFETIQRQEMTSQTETGKSGVPTVELRESIQPDISVPTADPRFTSTDRRGQLSDIIEQQLGDRQSVQDRPGQPLLDPRMQQPDVVRPQPIMSRQTFTDTRRPSVLPLGDFRPSVTGRRAPLLDPRGSSMVRRDRITDLRPTFLARSSSVRRPFINTVRT